MKRLTKQEIHEKNIENIENAVLDLMQENDTCKVSISQICERAGVSRQTFYKFYQDFDDVFTKAQFNRSNKLFVSIIQYIKENDAYGFAYNLLKVVKDNKNLARLFFDKNDFSTLDSAEKFYDQLNIPEIRLRKYEKEYYIGAFNGVIRRWIQNDCEDSIEELAQFLAEMIS
ncbi:MAG: TetR/AcrR family transcriptional regulator [Erysipelotrichaceae bacterium]|nr:TetR/AcrR family transcriptional regulator [Erysipelotrichaceae bacterium]